VFVTFAVASDMPPTTRLARFVILLLDVILHDEVWRKVVGVLRRRRKRRIGSLLRMRSSGHPGGSGAGCFVP